MTEEQLKDRGQMAVLMDDIKVMARERDYLLSPLRDRLHRAMPKDRFPSDLPHELDVQAAKEELQSVAAVETRLSEAITAYNNIASRLALPLLKRNS